MNDGAAELEDFGKRWVAAELAQDVTVLDALTHKDFILVGPLGFVIDKAQWLVREDGAWRLAGMHLSPMSVPREAQQQTE